MVPGFRSIPFQSYKCLLGSKTAHYAGAACTNFFKKYSNLFWLISNEETGNNFPILPKIFEIGRAGGSEEYIGEDTI